jgi:hypothetical protein
MSCTRRRPSNGPTRLRSFVGVMLPLMRQTILILLTITDGPSRQRSLSSLAINLPVLALFLHLQGRFIAGLTAGVSRL